MGTEPEETGRIEDIFLKNTELIFFGFLSSNIGVHRLIIIPAVYVYIMLYHLLSQISFPLDQRVPALRRVPNREINHLPYEDITGLLDKKCITYL